MLARLIINQEYRDPQRTYSDAARTLAAYPTLSPRTEVYTAENGSSSLLLTLSGTVTASFKGTTYRYPIKLWVPQSYPQEAPIVFVAPGKEMLVRPGQHVGVDGRVYHPYLRDWTGMRDRASLAEFLGYLQQVFNREPPGISRAPQQQFQRPIGQTPPPQSASGASSGPPQLPPKQRTGSVEPVEMPSGSMPPPRPPKPGESTTHAYPQRTDSRSARDGPPLPPLPHERPAQQHTPQPYPNGRSTASRPVSHMISPPPTQNHHGGRPQSMHAQGPYQQPLQYDQLRIQRGESPVSPVSPSPGYTRPVDNRGSHPPPQPQLHGQPYQYGPPGHLQAPQQWQQPPQSTNNYQRGPPNHQYPPYQQYPQQQAPQPQQPQKPAPPPDLLSDPFDVALPGPNADQPPAPAPPIPPNPEKEHLLHALSATLVAQAHAKVNQNLSAIAPLQAQHEALLSAHQRLEAEIRQLDQLSATLASNEEILHKSIADCDAVISGAKRKPQPNIDEVLVAPTMVAQQLWTVCSEEAGCKEAMYVLQKALDRGRITGPDFVRQMRSLGREAFGKMVVARKAGRGMGLDVQGR